MDKFPAPLLPCNPKEADWVYFSRQFTNYLAIVKADEDQKLPLLLNCIGRDGLMIYDGLPEPKSGYQDTINRFNDHFTGRTSILLKRKFFYEAKQGADECVSDFACRLRRLVAECDLGSTAAVLLRDIFVIGVMDDRLGERLLAEDSKTLTFELALAKAESYERAKLERGRTVAAIRLSMSTPKVGSTKPASVPGKSMNRNNNFSNPSGRQCYRCGSGTHKANNPSCPAVNAVCGHCGKVGHYQRMCLSKEERTRQPTKAQVRGIQSSSDSKTDSFPSNEYKIFSSSNSVACKDVLIDDKLYSVILDSGAEVNVMPRYLMPDKTLTSTKVRIKSWGNFDIPVLGSTVCKVTCNSHEIFATFFVVDIAAMQPLFSLTLLRQLDLISELACVKSNVISLNCLETEFPSLFDVNNSCINTGYKYRVALKDECIPYSAATRRVPPALLPKVKSALDDMEEKGVIRKIDNPTDHCAPMVIALKPSGDLRICCDLRRLNQSLKREMYQMPTFDELSVKVRNPKIWSRLDCKNSFWQVPVHTDSQEILTFSSPFGRYCYQRLPFGIASAPEVFTRVLQDILSGIDNILVYVDDIVVVANDMATHNATLRQVCKRLTEAGVSLNKEKCKIATDRIEFLGHMWSSDGISSDPDKLVAIKDMSLPSEKDTLRSFLGLAGYMGQNSIPHMSTITRPLWELMKSDQKTLNWSEKSKHAFEVLRTELLSDRCRTYFDPAKKVTVQTDASPFGLGSVLLQEGKIVMFASRNLTATERRYSQIEREFLGIVFGLRRFAKLLVGLEFELQTDHLPIVQLFKKPIDVLSNRLQRWMITIQHFTFHISHIKGSDNILADHLSRNAIDSCPSEEENVEYTLCFILTSHPVNLKIIADVSQNDTLLLQLADHIQTGWTKRCPSQLRPFFLMKSELTLKCCSGKFVVCRGDRVLIPEKLKQRILDTGHEGHVGVTKMKSNIRSHAFWLGMNADIEEHVRKCTVCTMYQRRCDAPPLTAVAEKVLIPWEKLSIDLTGPSHVLDNNVLLTAIDMFSRYPEVCILHNASALEIVKNLRSMFARFGLPKVIISDNGSVFRSAEFGDFLNSCGIKHVFSSLYHPRGNSTIERMHGTLKNRLKRIRENSKVSLESAIDQVLYDIRSSPNDITGETPFMRLFNRPMSTKLAQLNDQDAAPVMRKRNVDSEYAKRWASKDKNYKPGQSVLVRKGDRQPFDVQGIIKRTIGKYTYVVEINGREVRYNQRNLKPSGGYFPNVDCYDADRAYDDVTPIHVVANRSSNDVPAIKSDCIRRYPSRNRKPPQLYGERYFH